jgi:hypothetical protein
MVRREDEGDGYRDYAGGELVRPDLTAHRRVR